MFAGHRVVCIRHITSHQISIFDINITTLSSVHTTTLYHNLLATSLCLAFQTTKQETTTARIMPTFGSYTDEELVEWIKEKEFEKEGTWTETLSMKEFFDMHRVSKHLYYGTSQALSIDCPAPDGPLYALPSETTTTTTTTTINGESPPSEPMTLHSIISSMAPSSKYVVLNFGSFS